MIAIFPYLKHRNITVIVQTPPKAAKSRDASETAIPDSALFEDVRPSDGASLSSRGTETSLEDMMRAPRWGIAIIDNPLPDSVSGTRFSKYECWVEMHSHRIA